MSKGLEALCYLEDIAHGRKMDLNSHELKLLIEKELKALEIIKEKRLNCDEIYHKNYEWYMLDHKNDDKSLIPSRKEYKLLKEVIE